MEALLNCLIWTSGIALIPISLGLCIKYSYIGILFALFLLFLYPIFQELLFYLFTLLLRRTGSLDRDLELLKIKSTSKYPIVYSPGYNITAWGLEKMHPFDSTKYRRIYEFLTKWGVLDPNVKIISPSIVSRIYLYEQWTFGHMMLLNYSLYIGKWVELPICFLPAWLIRWRVLNPMLRATYGTIMASIMAMERGIAINLSGGYHHACGNNGGGFCIYPDITIAIKMVRRKYKIKKVMIIDLDAHQGNGHERDFIGDADVYIIDWFRPDIYPNDREAKRAIEKEIHVFPDDDADSYLQKINCIPSLVDEFKPEFIMYNAGTDIMQGDPLSGLNISPQGIVDRDEFVINTAFDRNIPLWMVLSGGYQKSNAECIAESIKNIYRLLDIKEEKELGQLTKKY